VGAIDEVKASALPQPVSAPEPPASTPAAAVDEGGSGFEEEEPELTFPPTERVVARLDVLQAVDITSHDCLHPLCSDPVVESSFAAVTPPRTQRAEDDGLTRILSESPTVSPWQGMEESRLPERRSEFQWKDGVLVRASAPVNLVAAPPASVKPLLSESERGDDTPDEPEEQRVSPIVSLQTPPSSSAAPAVHTSVAADSRSSCLSIRIRSCSPRRAVGRWMLRLPCLRSAPLQPSWRTWTTCWKRVFRIPLPPLPPGAVVLHAPLSTPRIGELTPLLYPL
jgi:hypothetical protein